jgi:hypothetical protein
MYCNAVTHLISLYSNGTYMTEDDTIADGGWEDCCIASEHLSITDLFLYNFINLVYFPWNFGQLEENF